MKVVFLDRDGTVIQDPRDERVDHIEEVKLFPDTLRALSLLAEAGFKAVFITNQAGIAEGLMTQADFEKINADVLKEIEPSGLQVLNTYFCPHGMNEGCACRKPQPKMILEAARD